MRMLIVDDDHFARNMMEGLTEDIAECVIAKSGSGALTAFKKALEKWVPFDIITLDINMPDISGKEVLKMIRKFERGKKIPAEEQVKILMATAHSDKDTIISCLKEGCNEYITKPYQKDILFKKLEKLGFDLSKASNTRKAQKEQEGDTEEGTGQTVKEAIDHIMENYDSYTIDLPTLPKVVTEIQDLLNKPAVGIDELAKVVETDLAISEKLVSVSNSVFYRGTESIESVQKAISRMGVKETEGIVMAIANKSLYTTNNVKLDKLFEKLWSHSLACAYSARSIAIKMGIQDIEKYFFMGLVHDIGKPLLLKFLTESREKKSELDMDELIHAIQEAHLNFGAVSLKRWGFRKDFINAARRHEDIEIKPTTRQDIQIIHLANRLCRLTGHSLFEDDTHPADLESAKALKMDGGTLNDIAEEVKNLMYESVGAF